MEIFRPEVDSYIERYSTATNGLLKEIENYTLNHHAHSVMLSGPVQGKFLELISKAIRPRRILEVGTFTGYSALCMAQGLVADGELHTIELRHEDAVLAQSFFARSLHANQIHLHEGNALEVIPRLDDEWDLVFIDADKSGYIRYYEMILPKLKNGGIMLVDNVLFHGQVLDDEIKGKNAKAIHAFNEHVANDKRTNHVILTIRDGVMMIMKN